MIIEMNKDIDDYKEGIVMGLSAREFIYSVVAVICAAAIVWVLHSKVGLMLSCYIAIPIVVPIALNGFGNKNGMNFIEMQVRRAKCVLNKKPLVYASTNTEQLLKEIEREKMIENQKKQSGQDEIKNIMKIVKLVGAATILCIIGIIMYVMMR